MNCSSLALTNQVVENSLYHVVLKNVVVFLKRRGGVLLFSLEK